MNERTVVFVRCSTSDGQFSSERSVTVETRGGTVSFFADRRLIRESANGSFVRVGTLAQGDEPHWQRVVLPQEPFETGNPLVEVEPSMVQDKP